MAASETGTTTATETGTTTASETGTATATELVLSERSDGVRLLTLNRPERNNGWTQSLEERYFDLLAEADADPRTRAIVVTGAGKTFCPGFDMQELAALSSGQADRVSAPRRPQTFPLGVRKPIVAAINGACAGIGLVQALMCDVRFAAAGAKLTTAFSQRGLVAEHGTSWMLPRLAGHAVALDLLLSSRVFLAEEAERLGVVNWCVPREQLLDRALGYARELAASCSPAAMAAIKAQVYGDATRTLDEAVTEANRLMAESFGRPDFAEGVQSFVERRPPRFAPLPEE